MADPDPSVADADADLDADDLLAGDADTDTEAARPPAETAVVPAALAGQRLDAAAAGLFRYHSRARLKAGVEDGRLTVNGERALRPRQPVAEGDVLVFQPPPEDLLDPAFVAAEDIPLEVVFADEHLAVVNKPAGLTVHPGAGCPGGTLMNALLACFPETRRVPRAGIVHRLDKDTSGLLVVARTPETHTRLVAMMAAREIRREYDAVVNGAVIAGGSVDAPVARHPRDRVRMAVIEGGRHALTHYRVTERFPRHTRLRLRLATGRTHQIRVHLAHLGFPVTGDPVYGGDVGRGKGMDPGLRAAIVGLGRQALHAAELALAHPVTGRQLVWQAPWPGDMAALVARLRADAARTHAGGGDAT